MILFNKKDKKNNLGNINHDYFLYITHENHLYILFV